jgi:protein-L-isoaspartate(D-aspartate) O-methyltransferase
VSVGILDSERLRGEMVDRLRTDHEAKGFTLRPEVEAALCVKI